MFSPRLMQSYQLHNCPLVAASISTTAGGEEKGGRRGEDEGDKEEREEGKERWVKEETEYVENKEWTDGALLF